MHSTALYRRANECQYRDAKETIDKNWNKLNWSKTGGDTILDIGCGIGDITCEYIWPNCPENCDKLCAIDSCDEMIYYCRKNWSNPKIWWQKYDICGDLDKQTYKHEPYNHIVSYNCLNWVQDQKTAFQNCYKLLKKGGDMLWGGLVQSPVYDIYKEMSKDPKWSKYMSNVDQWISPYQWSKNPVEDYKKLMKSCGYKDYWAACIDKSWVYYGCDQLKDAYRATNPWWDNIPADEQEAYWNCFLDWCVKKGYCLDDWKANPQTCRFKDTYKWMVGWCEK